MVGELNIYFFMSLNSAELEGTLGRPRHRWESNVKIDFKEIEHKVWTDLSQNMDQRWVLVNTVMKHNNP